MHSLVPSSTRLTCKGALQYEHETLLQGPNTNGAAALLAAGQVELLRDLLPYTFTNIGVSSQHGNGFVNTDCYSNTYAGVAEGVAIRSLLRDLVFHTFTTEMFVHV